MGSARFGRGGGRRGGVDTLSASANGVDEMDWLDATEFSFTFTFSFCCSLFVRFLYVLLWHGSLWAVVLFLDEEAGGWRLEAGVEVEVGGFWMVDWMEGEEGILYHTTSLSTDGRSFVLLYCWSRL